jgi:hypothetical protein
MTIERPASAIDYAEHLSMLLPIEQKGYVLARVALAHCGNETFGERARLALETLDSFNSLARLQPPLEDQLAEEILDFTKTREDHGPQAYANEASVLLLAWALENEARGLASG